MTTTQAQKDLKAYQATVTENQVKLGCLDLLLRLGWLVIRINSGATTRTDKRTGKEHIYKFCTWQAPGFPQSSAGVSDILALAPWGQLWAVECKRPGKLGSLTRPQRDFQAAVRAGGGVAIVCDNVDLLEQEIAKRKR